MAGKSSKIEFLCARRGVPTGLLIHYILHKLASKPAYGYELLSDVEHKTQGVWRPSSGSLYPLFKKMLERGLIEVKEVKVGRRSRRLYSITQKGRSVLKGAKEFLLNASQRFAASRRLLLEILDAEEIPRFISEGSKLHFNLLRAIIEDGDKKLDEKTLSAILDVYARDLTDELEWIKQKIKQMKRKEEVKGFA